MTSYILDTNHLSEALNQRSNLWRRLVAARRQGHRIGSCPPVLCELAAGIEQTARKEKNWKRLHVLLKQVRIWTITLEAVRCYGKIYNELRAKGRVLSQVDMMVAALAREMKLTVLATDRDFGAISDIAVEDWVSSAAPA